MLDIMFGNYESGGTLEGSGDAKRNDFWADEDESYEASSTAEDWN